MGARGTGWLACVGLALAWAGSGLPGCAASTAPDCEPLPPATYRFSAELEDDPCHAGDLVVVFHNTSGLRGIIANIGGRTLVSDVVVDGCGVQLQVNGIQRDGSPWLEGNFDLTRGRDDLRWFGDGRLEVLSDGCVAEDAVVLTRERPAP